MKIDGRGDVMEQIKTRELMSAMADGQLEGEAFARGVELATSDPAAREAWHAYHLIGDVLRSSDLAAGMSSQVFLSRLQVRIRQEAIPAPVLEQSLLQKQERATIEAANDGNFRWKLVAGFASVVAMGAIAWTVAFAPDNKQETGVLAAARVGPAASGTMLVSGERGVMIRDPRLDELLAAHRQLGAAAVVAPAGYLRNATFDAQGR